MHYRKSFLIGLLLIVGGGLLYLLFRSRQVLLLYILDSTPLSHSITQMRGMASAWQPSEWVVYSLPGGLWSAAYILVIHGLMHTLETSVRWRWACVIPLMGTFSELGQALHLIPGTFDVADLVCYLLPYIIYSFYLKLKIYHHEQ